MKIIFIGPPGAGKGTQAQLITKRFNIPHISTGDILREAIKNKTVIGLEAKAYVEKGGLVPDDVINKIVTLRLEERDCGRGFILDGYPRTEKQALELDKGLSQQNKEIEYVFYFETSTPVIIKRLSGRRICKNCQAVYHTKNMPPKKEGICDKCGGTLYQRPDDVEETIKNRLEVYLSSTEPVIDYYQGKKKLIKVNGDLSADKLFEILIQLFTEKEAG
ncbi:MAG: adenylate kinase [Candidatus Omnitrophota bacterium]